MNVFDQVQILPMTQATLCFLVRYDHVLLAMKKRGFGNGKWNGVGGKQDKGETIEQTMVRETHEEIGVLPTKFERMAILDFKFLPQPEWDQQVHVYIATEWQGEPVETEEMAPKWHAVSAIPYGSMWSDDPFWLPRILDGQKIYARFSFNEQSAVVDHTITQIT